jgi:Domain of unknown function (DUF3859)
MNSAWIALFGAGLCLAGTAAAQQAQIDRVVIVEAGLLEARKVDTLPTPGTASGETSVLDSVVFYEASRQVPARIGIQFGARYRIVGAPAGHDATIRTKWLVPEPGMRNPLTGQVTHEDAADETVVIGTDRLAGYKFGQSWEIVPGKWTLEFWAGDRKLNSVTFTVGNE